MFDEIYKLNSSNQHAQYYYLRVGCDISVFLHCIHLLAGECIPVPGL